MYSYIHINMYNYFIKKVNLKTSNNYLESVFGLVNKFIRKWLLYRNVIKNFRIFSRQDWPYYDYKLQFLI